MHETHEELIEDVNEDHIRRNIAINLHINHIIRLMPFVNINVLFTCKMAYVFSKCSLVNIY